MQPDDVDGVTVIRGKADKSEVVLTLDPRGMRLTHPRRSYEYDVAWSEVEDVKVVDVVMTSAGPGAHLKHRYAAFRVKPAHPGFLASLKRRLKDWDEAVFGIFDQSPEELVELIERYRVRHQPRSAGG